MLEAHKKVKQQRVCDGSAAIVRVDALRKFHEVVASLGGHANELLEQAQIDPAILRNQHAVIGYRSLVNLLEAAARSLRCPDFGMRLAKAQAGMKVLGPLEYVMRNSPTVREAFRYCARYIQVYGTASQLRSKRGILPEALCFELRMLVSRLPAQPQNIERVLLLTHDIARTISAGVVGASEVWLTHAPLSHPDRYREYFGTEVRFSQSMNAIFFREHELDLPIRCVDEHVYEISTEFIQRNFPRDCGVVTARVSRTVERLLADPCLSLNSVASALGMRARTLQRYLQAEGESLESIHENVRRDTAVRYLQHSELSLFQITKLLGYADTSVLSRSCQRWFSLTAMQIRAQACDVSFALSKVSA